MSSEQYQEEVLSDQQDNLAEREHADPWEGRGSMLEGEAPQEGGDPCNTPPSNSQNNINKSLINNKYQILGSNYDTLIISLKALWKDDNFIKGLEDKKKEAQSTDEDVDVSLYDNNFDDYWMFIIQSYGSKNFAFILSNYEYVLKISRSLKPESPNVLIEIRSLTLWRLGKDEAVSRILNLIRQLATSVYEIKPSRVDLCVDITMPEKEWSIDLLYKRVTRAQDYEIYGSFEIFKGLRIGSGDLFARFYDKEIEIRDHSKKYWMYGIWGVEKFKSGRRIIRVEFQIRRPVLKSFKIDDLDQLDKLTDNLWAYLTNNWLKLLVKKERNLDRQKLLPWWEAVQQGFGENNKPADRLKNIARRQQQDQTAKLCLSYLTNLKACEVAATRMPIDAEFTLDLCFKTLMRQINIMGIDRKEITKMVRTKIAKYRAPDNEKVPF